MDGIRLQVNPSEVENAFVRNTLQSVTRGCRISNIVELLDREDLIFSILVLLVNVSRTFVKDCRIPLLSLSLFIMHHGWIFRYRDSFDNKPSSRRIRGVQSVWESKDWSFCILHRLLGPYNKLFCLSLGSLPQESGRLFSEINPFLSFCLLKSCSQQKSSLLAVTKFQ